MESSTEVPQRIKSEPPYNPEILLLGIYSKELKSGSWKDICTPMFITVLVIKYKLWKQLKYPLTEEWIKKIWQTPVRECYSTSKKNEILPYTKTWVNWKDIVLSEISQSQEDKYCVILLICGL